MSRNILPGIRDIFDQDHHLSKRRCKDIFDQGSRWNATDSGAVSSKRSGFVIRLHLQSSIQIIYHPDDRA